MVRALGIGIGLLFRLNPIGGSSIPAGALQDRAGGYIFDRSGSYITSGTR